MIGAFMGVGAAPPANQGASGSVGVEDNIKQQGQRRQLFGGLFGGGGAGNAKGKKTTGPPEAGVAAAQGAGTSTGLPTCADDGTVTMTLRQVRHLSSLFGTSLTQDRSIRMVLVPSQPM
jgi:hypothetical protein